MYEKYLINANVSLKEAMKKLELLTKDGNESLYVLENEILIGTLAISDIRRALIKRDVNNSMPVKEFVNRNFKYLVENKNYSVNELKKLKKFKFIPILDKNKKFIRFEDIIDLISHKNKIILMAGGLGSRLGDLTKNTPKPMLKIGNKPILELIIEQFKKYNFYNFYISVNYKAEIIENYFKNGNDFGVNINYLKEKKKLGTVGCLSLIEDKIEEPIILMNGDIITSINFENMLKYHGDNDFLLTIGAARYNVSIPYGVLNVKNQILKKIEEKPIRNFLISGGVYIISPNIIRLIPKNEYFDIPMLIEKIIDTKKVGVFNIENEWIDIGHIEDFFKVQEKYIKGEL